jgi:hypothetical protein
VIEVLYDHQPWPIGFPEEIAVPGRTLVARDKNGVEVARWDQDPGNDARRATGVLPDTIIWESKVETTPKLRQWWLWHQIISECMHRGWTLTSMPPGEKP